MAEQTKSRYAVLDSYRAIAALLVVLYHYFHRWVEPPDALLPAVAGVSDNAVVARGDYGVEFFFLISGFVISMTLYTTSGFVEFCAKRFSRLFPTMLACSALTFAIVSVLQVDPFADVEWIDFLPSLTFTEPWLINKALGTDAQWISGVYWSLFVEIKFYLCVAVFYFARQKSFLRDFAIFTFVMCGLQIAALATGREGVATYLDALWYPSYAGLFLAGMGFYELFRKAPETRAMGAVLVLSGLLYSMYVFSPLAVAGLGKDVGWVSTAVIFAFFVLFWLFVQESPVTKVFAMPWLAHIGAASYSLYLLHESIGVSGIVRANESLGASPLWTVAMIVVIVLASVAFYDWYERPASRLMRRVFQRVGLLPQSRRGGAARG